MWKQIQECKTSQIETFPAIHSTQAPQPVSSVTVRDRIRDPAGTEPYLAGNPNEEIDDCVCVLLVDWLGEESVGSRQGLAASKYLKW